MKQNEKYDNDESRRDFLKRLLSTAGLMSAGLFFGSKSTLAYAKAVASGKCSSSYACSGGSGKCGSSYSCSGKGSGGHGKCGSSCCTIPSF